jgi:hypothetical protein
MGVFCFIDLEAPFVSQYFEFHGFVSDGGISFGAKSRIKPTVLSL